MQTRAAFAPIMLSQLSTAFYGHSIMVAKPPFRAMSMLSVGSIFVVDFTIWPLACRAAFLPSACMVIF